MHKSPITLKRPNPAHVNANANVLDPSPYGVFYGSENQRADRLFVFVTRAGRVMARHADGTVRDVACEIMPPMCA